MHEQGLDYDEERQVISELLHVFDRHAFKLSLLDKDLQSHQCTPVLVCDNHLVYYFQLDECEIGLRLVIYITCSLLSRGWTMSKCRGERAQDFKQAGNTATSC